MKIKGTMAIMSLTVIPDHTNAAVSNGTVSYIIGGIFALLIMCYLIYILLQPDKF